MLGKCVLRLWTDLVVDKGYERDTLNTLLILDECITLLANDEDFGRNFLDKGRSMGAGAVLAYQFISQWIGNETTLGNLLENCGTLMRLTPFSPREAEKLNRDELPKEKVETIEITENRSLIDVDEQLFARTGTGAGRHEHDWEHYPSQYLASVQHEALLTGYYNGLRIANRLLCVEKDVVRELAEAEQLKGNYVYLAKPEDDNDWVDADIDVADDAGDSGVDMPHDTSWADGPDAADEAELIAVVDVGDDVDDDDWEPDDAFDAWAARGTTDYGDDQ
jgi:hypothetical protein